MTTESMEWLPSESFIRSYIVYDQFTRLNRLNDKMNRNIVIMMFIDKKKRLSHDGNWLRFFEIFSFFSICVIFDDGTALVQTIIKRRISFHFKAFLFETYFHLTKVMKSFSQLISEFIHKKLKKMPGDCPMDVNINFTEEFSFDIQHLPA